MLKNNQDALEYENSKSKMKIMSIIDNINISIFLSFNDLPYKIILKVRDDPMAINIPKAFLLNVAPVKPYLKLLSIPFMKSMWNIAWDKPYIPWIESEISIDIRRNLLVKNFSLYKKSKIKNRIKYLKI